MGNSVSTSSDSVAHRKQKRAQQVQKNRERLHVSTQSTQLLTSRDARKTRMLMHAMDTQLQRGGKPFTKADLVGILLYISVLRGRSAMRTVQHAQMKTCEDLRVEVCETMYSSPETLEALQFMANPSALPMARRADVVPESKNRL